MDYENKKNLNITLEQRTHNMLFVYKQRNGFESYNDALFNLLNEGLK